MLTGHDIICISSIDWDFIWQGHQQIMATFAAQGNRVLFIENTGVRTPRLRDLERVRARLRNWRRGTGGFRQERPNLFVYSPLVVPFPYARLARWMNASIVSRAIRRWMRATGFGRPIIWSFLPTPLARSLMRELDPLLTVYYCIDDLASSSPQARRITQSEIELFKEADLVFVTSERLRQRAARSRPDVHLFPFGVNLQQFEEARLNPQPPPEEMQSLPRPILGYVGGLHQWVDQDLLIELAGRMPDASLVLVGPFQDDVSRLARCANVRLLGPKPHGDLPGYVGAFDVGLVPYRISDYTANVYPTKLNEYLAMGIPVVSTELPEIRRVNKQYGELVTTAPDAAAFVGAVRRVLVENDSDRRARRVEVAAENGWDRRIGEMSALIDDALGRRGGADAGWDALLRRIYRHSRRRTVGTIAAVAIAWMLVFKLPLLWVLAEPLKVSETPQPADAIVVFAGGVGESGQAGGGYQERVQKAVQLYQDGQAPNLVFSSGYMFAFKEVEVMRQLAVSLGVPSSAIFLETRAANTYENVLNTEAILREHGWKRILLVSSPYHMRRALLVWGRNAPSTEIVPTPPAQSQFYAHGWGASLDQVGGIVHEYVAIAAYWARGWI